MPETIPTKKPVKRTNNPINGFFAMRRNAASPIVAVRVATTDPKDIFPLVYCVITIMAPPQPGKAPRNEQPTISNLGCFFKNTPISKLRNFSNE